MTTNSDNQKEMETSSRNWSFMLHPVSWVAIGTVLSVLWAVVAGAYAWYAWSDANGEYTYSLRDYMIEAGFDPSVEHPITVGNTIEGTAGEARGSASIFFGTGSGSFNSSSAPSSAVKVLVPVGSDEYRIVEITTTEITFEKASSTEASSIQFLFNDIPEWGSVNVDWSYPGDGGFGEFWFFKQPVLDENQPGIRDTELWQQFNDRPLLEWLSENSDGVVLRLSDQELDKVLS